MDTSIPIGRVTDHISRETVLTFLAVFLIQHTQNRDGRVVPLKLDELISSTKTARNRLIDLEHLLRRRAARPAT